MVTVEADQVRVESRLTAGQLECPDCPGVLAPWGFARPRGVRGVGSLRPRRARCLGCLVTHVLLPVTVLLRRADAAEVIGAALLARAAGHGHRRIAACCWACRRRRSGAGCGGWRSRLEAVRVHFTVVARLAGVDLAVPKATRVAVAGRARGGGRGDDGGDRPVRHGRGDRPGDGVAGRGGVVSGARLLSPGWPTGFAGCRCQHELPLTDRPVGPGLSRGSLPGNTCRAGPSDDEMGSALW